MSPDLQRSPAVDTPRQRWHHVLQLEHQTVHDELTGLHNRRGFLSQAQQMSDFTAARRMSSAPASSHTIESLLRTADEAQYAKKRQPRATETRLRPS